MSVRKVKGLMITGLSGKRIFEPLHRTLKKYLSDGIRETMDFSFLVPSVLDRATWCSDVDQLRQDPVNVLIDVGVPCSIARETFDNLVVRLQDVLETVENELDAHTIDIKITSNYFITITLLKKKEL